MKMNEDEMNINAIFRMSRRTFVKMAGVAASAVAFGAGYRAWGGTPIPPAVETGCKIQEFQPYVSSPFIVSPFMDIPENQLPQPQAMKPGYRQPDGTLIPANDPQAWAVRKSPLGLTISPPDPGLSRQDSYGQRNPGDILPFFPDGVNQFGDQTVDVVHDGTHQVWPTTAGQNSDRLVGPVHGPLPDPRDTGLLYHIRLQVRTHSFTTSKVRPTVPPPAGAPVILDANGETTLPPSVIYGFNGTFPGPMINVDYGKPVIVRFENDLDLNPLNLDRQDFGATDKAFLTHLHNGHTAPESDGQPHYMQINAGGYIPKDWVDNLYLVYPAGGDPSEIQSFLWFHDHRMHHTGANVYKGMVGLMPHYDPGVPDGAGGIVPGTGLDPGDETKGLHLPGVRVDNGDGTFDVKYDIPMALYDCALDDGVTAHADMHTPLADCGAAHPEWWGKTFFRHWPNHGFVGDIFTVNCTAYPVLHVFQRRYRFRFLGASVSRIYELALMTSAPDPVAMPGTQGQWQIPNGRLWKPWTWIASMGGLLPKAALEDTHFVWPASRREFEVDFTDAKPGDVIYITNVLEMPDGRKPNFVVGTPVNNRAYKVPLVKIIVDGPPPEPDQSVPVIDANGVARTLRPMPRLANGEIPTLATTAAAGMTPTTFALTRGGPGDEAQWVINDLPFDPLTPLHKVFRNRPEVWINKNGGGGWVHPMHMHMEENTVIERVGSTLPVHIEDTGKEDVTNLEPGESVTFYRNFRTFEGRYVAHCHNLAHEDHNMMFGFTILPPLDAGTTFAVSGTVINDINGNGIADPGEPGLAGVLMTVRDPQGLLVTTAPTDGAGNYSIAGLAPLAIGTYTLTPTKAGVTFVPANAAINGAAGANVTQNFVGTGPAAPATHVISGKVVNKNGRTPLQGVTMTLIGVNQIVAVTGKDGSYSFAGLAPGFYTVTPTRGNFVFNPSHAPVTITDADVTANFQRV